MEKGSAVRVSKGGWGVGGRETEILKCDSNLINAFLNHYREGEWYLHRPPDPPATGNGFLSYTNTVAP